MLSELTDEDPSLRLMKRALINNKNKNFCRFDAYLKSFWQCSAVVDGCFVKNNRIPIPNCLQTHLLHDITDHTRDKLPWWTRHKKFGGPGCIEKLFSCVKTALSVLNLVRILKLTLRLNRPHLISIVRPNEELQLD